MHTMRWPGVLNNPWCVLSLGMMAWLRGDGRMAQLLERRTRREIKKTRGSNGLSGAQDKFVRVFPSQKWCADSLSVGVPNPCVITYAR